VEFLKVQHLNKSSQRKKPPKCRWSERQILGKLEWYTWKEDLTSIKESKILNICIIITCHEILC